MCSFHEATAERMLEQITPNDSFLEAVTDFVVDSVSLLLSPGRHAFTPSVKLRPPQRMKYSFAKGVVVAGY